MSQVVPPETREDPRAQLSRPDALYEIVDGQIRKKNRHGKPGNISSENTLTLASGRFGSCGPPIEP
jgi:hypothetical protein